MSGDSKAGRLDWRTAEISTAPDADASSVAGLVSGEAWERFCEVLRVNGEKLLQPDLPDTDLDRATGYRHLLAMVQKGIHQALAAPNPLRPTLDQWPTNVYKFGHDCPDALYRFTPIRGDVTYRVHGNIGSARYLSFQLEGPNGTVGNLRADEMDVDPDGSYEAWFSPEPHAGNWLQSNSDTDQLFVRQFFSDWDNEVAATARIEAMTGDGLSDEAIAHPGRPSRVAAQFDALGKWFEAITDYYLERELTDKVAWPNAFMPTRTKAADGGANEMLLGHGHFDIGPAQALIIEVEPAQALYWSLDIANPWRESLDYAIRQTSLNDSQALLDQDGMFRAVIAHTDPGVPNWLDTMGHTSGALIFRWILADRTPEPRLTVVPHNDIRQHLPPETPMVSAEARLATIAGRISHVQRRFAS